MATGTPVSAVSSTPASPNKRIPDLPPLPTGTVAGPAWLVPAYDPVTDLTYPAPVGQLTAVGQLTLSVADLLSRQAAGKEPVGVQVRVTGRKVVEAVPQPDVVLVVMLADQVVFHAVQLAEDGTQQVGTYDLQEDEFAPAGTGGGAETPFTLTPTETIGGIAAGVPFTGTSQQYWQKVLVRYQRPAFGAFLLGGQGTRTVPVGTVFPAGFKAFTWSTSNAGNVAANSLSLRDVTANTVLATGEANDGTLSASTAAFTAVKGLSRTYLLSGTDTQSNVFTADLSVYGAYESYFGYSANGSLTGTQLVALGNAQLQTGRQRTVSGVTATGGAYTYYAYDAAEGDLTSIILDGAAPVLGAFQKLADVAATNAAGASIMLRVYRSNAPNAFSNNSLAFS